MFKCLLLLVIAITATNANAQLFKCKGADGKTQFSDTPCKAGVSSEIMPDRAPVTRQQQYDAQQRAQQMQNEAGAIDGQRAAAQASSQVTQQRQEAASVQKTADAKVVANDAEAISNCVRDVERRGASQNVKAEMIAACRTAGLVQRSTGISGDVVSDCVKRVERTGASEKDKARQLATCHGGDVQPEPPPPPKPKPSSIASCDSGGCWDNLGNRYNRAGKTLVQTNGRSCQQIGNMLHCN